MEQSGSIIVQSLSGILLDIKSGNKETNPLQSFLNTLVLLNVLQGGAIWFLAYLQYKQSPIQSPFVLRESFAMESIPNRSETNAESVAPLLNNDDDSTLSEERTRTFEETQMAAKEGTARRGKIIASICVVFVILAWILVMSLAIEDFAH